MKSSKQHFANLQTSTRTRWVAVGDASRFIIFEKKQGEPVSEVKTFSNESAHSKISDMVTGQPGRSFDSFSQSHGGHQTGTPRHSFAGEQDPKTHAIENFLREVSAFLNAACNDHQFEHLVVVTNSRLLGILRPLLSKNTQETVSEERAKDFAWLSGAELKSRVEELLALS